MASLGKIATTVVLLGSVALLGGCSKGKPAPEVPGGEEAAPADENAESFEREGVVDPDPADADADVTDPDPG